MEQPRVEESAAAAESLKARGPLLTPEAMMRRMTMQRQTKEMHGTETTNRSDFKRARKGLVGIRWTVINYEHCKTI